MGRGRLYRVYQENKQRPLYIGMAYEASIQSRVASHFKSVMTKAGNLAKTRRVGNLAALGAAQVGALKSEIAKLRALTAAAGMSATIKVQHGEVVTPAAGQRIDPKLLHAFEVALQVLERPHSERRQRPNFRSRMALNRRASTWTALPPPAAWIRRG